MYGSKTQFQHGWNVFWSIMSVSAWLQYLFFKNVNYIMAGMCCGQNCQFQYSLNVEVTDISFSIAGMCGGKKMSVLEWLEYLSVKNVSFIMAVMCCR
jgi:hypothetical protein